MPLRWLPQAAAGSRQLSLSLVSPCRGWPQCWVFRPGAFPRIRLRLAAFASAG
jgi:hypothetical protein